MFAVIIPVSDFLLLLASHGCVILKLKSSGRKYASISCASVTAAQSAVCSLRNVKCATLFAVFVCNGCRLGVQYGAFCSAKRHVLKSKTGRFAVCFVWFYYQSHDFRVCGPCFLTVQTCPRYLVVLFPTPVFWYNIVYKYIPE